MKDKDRKWMDGGLRRKLRKLCQALHKDEGPKSTKSIQRRMDAVFAAAMKSKDRRKSGAVAMDMHDLEAERDMENRFMEAVWKSDGFDLENVTVPQPLAVPFFSVYSPSEDSYGKHIIVYAKLGIRLYNMLQGKNLQFVSMVKYNYLSKMVRCSNFITCVAKDPDCSSLQHFQSGVTEEEHLDNEIEMLVSWFIARPKSAEKPVEPVERAEPVEHAEPLVPDDYYSALPRWPSSEKDFNDKSRYYLLKKSEVGKYDWIHLYLELAFAKANTRLRSEPDLYKLVITRVAVETGEGQEPLKERLETGNATFYIKYKYYPKNCKFSRDRIAIIRRTFNKKTGLFSLKFNKCFEYTLL